MKLMAKIRRVSSPLLQYQSVLKAVWYHQQRVLEIPSAVHPPLKGLFRVLDPQDGGIMDVVPSLRMVAYHAVLYYLGW